jgi:cbb3-type cytochrome oxidase cytochrome c subunit
MSDLVNKVAELLNAPVDLVQRSAEARAAASGTTVDAVLNSWAGGESVTSAAPAAEAPKEETPVEEEVVEDTPVEEEVVEETPVEEEVVEDTPVEVVEEEVLQEVEKESSLSFVGGVVAIAIFTFLLGFSIPKNQEIAEVTESLNNSVEVTADVLKGAQVYNELNCQSCHTQNVRALIPDTQNGKVLSNKFANEALIKAVGNLRTAPDLSTNNTREPTNKAQWLERYLKDSTSVNRDIPHPSYTFVSESDLEYLITYLLSLGENNE